MVTPTSEDRPSDEALPEEPATPVVDTSDPNGISGINDPGSRPETPLDETPTSDSGIKHLPMQKRRRVTRACDECRRKKIKCDGKQPCTHCTVYSYECTYDQPSNRRRNPAPQYIEALEQRLQKAESILRAVLPGLDLDDPKFDARSVEQLVEHSRIPVNAEPNQNGTSNARPTENSKADDDAQLQSMVDRTGALDLDDSGNWDFHGHSSGYVYMRKFRAQFGDQFLFEYRQAGRNRTIAHMLESPKSANSSPYEFNLPTSVDLPPKEVAIELCLNTIDDCCALMRPLHRPTFFRRLHALYDTDPEQYKNDHVQFLPLLYVVMALGCLFSKTENENTMLDLKGYKEAIEQGYQYFNTAKQMLDITDCRDLMTIQTIVFMIMFLQSSANLPICYAYIGIALRACCRLGLHRNIPNKFNPIESEERKRIFWVVRKMDSYVGAVLGLPQMLSDEDIDQDFPTEIDDDHITENGLQPMPPGTFALLKATNAHTRLINILRKVVRYIYPVKAGDYAIQTDSRYSISHRRIRELERDLQSWMDQLPTDLRPSDNAPRDLSRVQQLLRMSYAHVQMLLYRPFIHYVSQSCQARNVDKRSFACAAACISVARNIVHITTQMKKRGLLVGSYWFVMYTTYYAILSLVFFVIENPNSPTSKDILKDAVEGRDTLAALAKRSLAADRCTASLTGLFDVLPEKLKERRSSLHPSPSTARKRPPPVHEFLPLQDRQSTPNLATANNVKEGSATPSRARTLPSDFLARLAKRNSMPDPHIATTPADAPTPQLANMTGYQSPATTSPVSAGFDFMPQMTDAHIPDLKNVMFPSDNPFAYPNQPISTLESVDGPYSFQDHNAGSNENSIFGTPTSGSAHLPLATPQHGAFDFSFQQALHENPSLGPQFGLHAGPMDPQLTDILMHNAIGGGNFHLGGFADLHEPSGMGDAPRGTNPEEYWEGMHRGPMGTKSGGPAPGVQHNTDEFFSSESWNPTWGDPHYNA